MKNWNETIQDMFSKELEIIENGETVKCPECKSKDVRPVHPFDYVKVCNKCKKEFSTGIHN